MSHPVEGATAYDDDHLDAAEAYSNCDPAPSAGLSDGLGRFAAEASVCFTLGTLDCGPTGRCQPEWICCESCCSTGTLPNFALQPP